MRIFSFKLLGLTTLLVSTCLGSLTFGDTASPEWLRLLNDGRDFGEREKYAEALESLEAARQAALRENAPELKQAEIWDALGAIYERTDKLPQAQEEFDRAYAVRRKLLPDRDEKLAISLTNES